MPQWVRADSIMSSIQNLTVVRGHRNSMKDNPVCNLIDPFTNAP